MRNKLHKYLAFLLSVLMVLTGVNPLTAKAATTGADAAGGYATTYSLQELANPTNWDASVTADGANTTISFPGQYNQAFYTIPQAVLDAGLTRVSVATAAGSVYDKLGLKIVKAISGAPEDDLLADFWTGTLNVPAEKAADANYLSFMSTEGNTSYTFSTVTFYTTGEVAGITTPGSDADKPVVNVTDTKIEIGGQIEFTNRWNGSDKAMNTVTYTGQYQSYVYTLPNAVALENIASIVIDVENQEKEFSVKMLTADGQEPLVRYGLQGAASYTVIPTAAETGDVTSFCIMSNPDAKDASGADNYPYSVTHKAITINLKEDSSNQPPTTGFGDYSETVTDSSMVLTGGLDLYNRWSSSQVMKNVLTFTDQYQEFVLDLPVAFDLEKLVSMTVEVENQDNELAVKFLDSGLSQIDVKYGVNGNTSYTFTTSASGMCSAVSFMSTAAKSGDAVYPYNATIKKVSFEMEPGSLTPPTNTKTELSDIQLYGRHDNVPLNSNTASFDALWNEVAFDLPEAVDLDKVESIAIKVANQGGVISFKLYNADKSSELQTYYGQSGKTTYTLMPSNSGMCTSIGVMAHDETDGIYPFGVTIESVTIKMLPDTGDSGDKGVEYDLYDLKDKVTAIMGDNFIFGTAISYQEFTDKMEMELVTKHFNAVTLGNELKPDSLLKANAVKEDVTINGQTITVPVLDYSTPETYLDFFYDWNQKHPDDQIKIRGHVLVWHSQMPEFFFHEDYDTTKPYVSTDLMNLRLEWYIKSVAEHFTGAGSKYQGMFYGWDVVNEAVSDNTGTYRNASENSSWWALYQSPEFITNAFVYANRYFPADVELYYNDYNDCSEGKSKAIATLLTAVKNTPGARIDAMGMQGHYQINDNPTMAQFAKAARLYSDIVGKVMVTELDFNGATSATDSRLTDRYQALYDTIRRLNQDGPIVSGLTIWGVVDKHSWLQTSTSIGGGSTTNAKQYPLLFNNNYKAKDAFYVFGEAGELEPEIKKVTIVETKDDSFVSGNTYTIGSIASFVPVWDNNGIKVKVTVSDATADTTDNVTVYVSENGAISSATVTRAQATATATGYEAIVTVPCTVSAISSAKFDVTVTDGTTVAAYNDTTCSQAASDKYYALVISSKSLQIDKGTVTVDGDGSDAAWAKATAVPLTISLGANISAEAKTLWDNTYLYVLMTVTDSVLNKDSADAYQQDSLELFIDENNHKADSYEADDKQYRINYENAQSFNGQKCTAENVVSAVTVTSTGYVIEAAFKWTDITPAKDTVIGIEYQINDADASGKRIGTLSWNDSTGTGYADPSVFGTAVLIDTTPAPAPVVTPVAPAPQPAVETVTKVVDVVYTVASGDSLSKIAKRNNLTLAQLLAMNPQITNPNRIYPGQKIVIGKTETTVSADAQTEDSAEITELLYIVKRGDSLSKIARRNNMTLAQILAANPQITNPNRIYPGQKLMLKK